MFGVDRTYCGHHETDAFVLELPPAFVRASGFAIAYGIGASLFGGTTQLIVTYLIGATGDPNSPALVCDCHHPGEHRRHLGVAKSRNWLRRKSRRNAKNADVEDASRFPVLSLPKQSAWPGSHPRQAVPACEQSPQSWPRSGISRRPRNPTRPTASRHILAA
jgi:hypothetical protein